MRSLSTADQTAPKPALTDVAGRYDDLRGGALVQRLAADFPGRVAVLSSFGSESAVLLDVVNKAAPGIPVLFLDTGKHFVDTQDYRLMLIGHLGLTDVRPVLPDPAALEKGDPVGRLHASDPDACCHLRKVQPLARAVQAFDVLIDGRKRYHGNERSDLPVVTRDVQGRLKASPLADWSPGDIETYMRDHRLPTHPLIDQGYRSIGCAPCTVKSRDGVRDGRWAGRAKTECGIHG